MAIDKSKWDKNIRVSQKTIDEIKKMGMKKALGTVSGATAAGKNVGDASAKEWAEGVKRLYTAERVNAAMKANKPKAATSGPMSANTKANYTYKSGGAKSMNTGKSSSKPATKSTLASYNKDTSKLPNNMSASGTSKKTSGLTPQKVAGTALTAAAIIASRGKFRGAGGLGKVSSSTLAKAKSAPKAAAAKVTVGPKGSFGKTTKSMAKKGVGTPSEYASRAAQFGGPTNITVKKTAKKAATKKAGKK